MVLPEPGGPITTWPKCRAAFGGFDDVMMKQVQHYATEETRLHLKERRRLFEENNSS